MHRHAPFQIEVRSIARLDKIVITIVLFKTQKLVVLLPYAGAVQIESVLMVGAVYTDRCGREKESLLVRKFSESLEIKRSQDQKIQKPTVNIVLAAERTDAGALGGHREIGQRPLTVHVGVRYAHVGEF